MKRIEYIDPRREALWAEVHALVEEAARAPAEAQRRKEEEERRKKERAAANAAERAREAEDRRQSRVRELILRYECEAFDVFEQDGWLKAYAKNHSDKLLSEEGLILDESLVFHQDTRFIELLKQQAPHVYKRAVWRQRALAYAYDVEEERPTETREQYHERRLRNLLTTLSQQVEIEKETQVFIERQLEHVEDEEEKEQMREELLQLAAKILSSMNTKSTKRNNTGDGKVLGRKE